MQDINRKFLHQLLGLFPDPAHCELAIGYLQDVFQTQAAK